MTATLHRIGAGDGYRYYTAMVASGDEPRGKGEKLGEYYTRSGNPPGRWIGSGLAAMGVAGAVQEKQLGNLLGLGLHPDTGASLGQRYRLYATVADRIAGRVERLKDPSSEQLAAIEAEEERKGERQAVAGFDSTFSPVKSVSVAWALATPEVAAQIEAAHDTAVSTTLAWIEREVLTARTGTDGVGHVDVTGAVAAAFTHRTSRAGDPDLHTHVVISNKVLATLPDGSQKWLSLDSRGLYKSNVAFSERYNRVLEDEISRRLGWEFQVRGDQLESAIAPIRELAHVPEPLIAAFSQRRQQIESDYAGRVREYRQKHGHEPPKAVQYDLAQAACLANRPAKEAGTSEASEREAWAQLARTILNTTEQEHLAAGLAAIQPAQGAAGLGLKDVRRYAGAVVRELQERRSDWTARHVAASAQRLTAAVRFASPPARDAAIAAIVEATRHLNDVVRVSAPERVETPQTLRRSDGTPIWQAPASERHTTGTMLAAEARLLDAAREHVPAGVHEASMDLLLSEHMLAPDQDTVVRHLALGDRRVQLLVGPAGTGKTTTMRALVDVWQRTAGRAVRGLAPTAAAASVLRTETGMDGTATIDLWATQRQHGVAEARFSPGELVIVDEAGMAGTLNLDRVLRAAVEDGAHVVLVGDPHQLAAIAAGGALRLIQHEAGAAELSTVWRFADVDPQTGERVLRQWEAEASLGLRAGDTEAVEAYVEHGRVHAGSREVMVDEIYHAWQRETQTGSESVMIATDNATVQSLSERARADRVREGLVRGPGVTLRNGSTASVGDIIVTRLNDRLLRVGGDFVKNGDLWTVEGVSEDGQLSVRGKHGVCVLPAQYVQRNVELGYAMTAHRAQGLTVDAVHVLVDETLTREVLYVAATRGRRTNQLYAVTEHLLDAEAERPADPNQPARAVLRNVVERVGAEPSATEAIRTEDQRAQSAATQLERWRYVQDLRGPAGSVLDEVLPAGLAQAVRDDDAWPYLREVLQWHGVEAMARLREAYESRPVASAESVARVLASRVHDNEEHRSDRAGDWLPRPSGDTYSDALIAAVRDRAQVLGHQAAQDRPEWSRQLGEVPTDPEGRREWQQRAGMAAAYREAFNVTDTRSAVGTRPEDAAQRAIWQRAAAVETRDSQQRPAQVEPVNQLADLTVEDVRQQLLSAERDRSRHAGRVARLRRDLDQYGTKGDGPAQRAVAAEEGQWRDRLARVERALTAKQKADEALTSSVERGRALVAHQSGPEPKRRGRAEWENAGRALATQAAQAKDHAKAAAAELGTARHGLPADPGQWEAMRARAQAALRDLPQRHQEAAASDAARPHELQAELRREDTAYTRTDQMARAAEQELQRRGVGREGPAAAAGTTKQQDRQHARDRDHQQER